MTWTIVGLICASVRTETGCLWYAPVTDKLFTTETACMLYIGAGDDEPLMKFRNHEPPYNTMKCRLTDQRRAE